MFDVPLGSTSAPRGGQQGPLVRTCRGGEMSSHRLDGEGSKEAERRATLCCGRTSRNPTSFVTGSATQPPQRQRAPPETNILS
jgi:hypothetical protein